MRDDERSYEILSSSRNYDSYRFCLLYVVFRKLELVTRLGILLAVDMLIRPC